MVMLGLRLVLSKASDGGDAGAGVGTFLLL